MEKLRRTRVDTEPLEPESKSLSLGKIFAARDQLARLSLTVSLISLACVLGLTIALVLSLQSRNKITVLDENGGVHVGTAKTVSEAQELQQHTALAATSALFSRNSQSFDDPEALQAYFSRNALVHAAAIKVAEAKQFDELKMDQKPRIARIDIRQPSPGEFKAQVTGELARTGIFEGRAFTDALPFTLELTLRANPDLLRNRLYPLVVTEFNLNYDENKIR